MNNKIPLDKYYTPEITAQHCIDKTYEIIGKENISEIIEPSAGNGSFSKHIPNCISYDIEPEHTSIIKQDYLKLKLPYKKGRLVIGNPPFGKCLNLARSFYKKSTEFADYIAFILPVSQYKNNIFLYQFDLIHSEVLGGITFSNSAMINSCFNIYRRPIVKTEREKIKLKGIDIYSLRKADNTKIPKYDFTICGWGRRIGKICEENRYAVQIYIRVKDTKYHKRIKALLEDKNWLKEINTLPGLSKFRLTDYIAEAFPELVELNEKKDIEQIKLKGVEIVEVRSKKTPPFKYDLTVCGWGGAWKLCKEKQYQIQHYLRIKDPNYLKKIKNLFEKLYETNISQGSNLPTKRLNTSMILGVLAEAFPELVELNTKKDIKELKLNGVSIEEVRMKQKPKNKYDLTICGFGYHHVGKLCEESQYVVQFYLKIDKQHLSKIKQFLEDKRDWQVHKLNKSLILNAIAEAFPELVELNEKKQKLKEIPLNGIKLTLVKRLKDCFTNIPPQNYDFTICSWGNIKVCNYNEYVAQIYLEIENKEYIEPIKNLILNTDWHMFNGQISSAGLNAPKLSHVIAEAFPELVI